MPHDNALKGLPAELITFLQEEEALLYPPHRCAAGRVLLHLLDELRVEDVYVQSNTVPDDPHRHEDGYYAVPAISLTAGCEEYDPEFILLWLPNERLYGTWDCDHMVLRVFPSATWKDIKRNPLAYLNAQWEIDTGVSTLFRPWPRYRFHSGTPS